jgi:hypothetical protein
LTLWFVQGFPGTEGMVLSLAVSWHL